MPPILQDTLGWAVPIVNSISSNISFNQEHKLLNKEELATVEVHNMDSGSGTFKELVTWCQRDVVAVRKAGYIETYEAIDLQNRVLNFRAAMDGIYDKCEQPTQFFYIHFLVMVDFVTKTCESTRVIFTLLVR